MYSDYRQKHISVVELRPGVTLEYHVVTHIKPLAAGEFWYEYSFPTYAALTDGTLEISLPKSRDIKLKSPERKYETREDGEGRPARADRVARHGWDLMGCPARRET